MTNMIKYLAVYVIWMLFSVSQLGIAVWMHQLIISAAMLYAQKTNNFWAPRAIDMWSMVVLGVIVLITIFVSEAYLNRGARQQRFWPRVGVLVLIEAIAAALLFGLEFFL